jgi:hypothetical protein
LAKLIVISEGIGEIHSHVIFIHGLGGSPTKTWQSSIDPDIVWPQWLAEDIEGLAVRSVGYEAAVSRWKGSAMHLPDRAANVIERILLEPSLNTGEIILIGHSLGGLVIKQMLRTAESLAHQREDVAGFMNRVRRIAFLATPHAGADLAIWGDRLRILFLPSAATACLVRNDHNLRDLNLWYRDWSVKHGIEHLILTETQPIKKLFFVVKPDSSDPGLTIRPIPIDADHFTICKPCNRSSEIYLHIRKFITRPLESSQHYKLNENIHKIQESVEILNGKMDAFHIASAPRKYPKGLIDNEIHKHLLIMQRARFFGGYSVIEHSIILAEKIQNGEFEIGSDAIKRNALAWCSRFLSIENGDKAEELLNFAKQFGNGEEVTIAEAFAMSSKKNLEGALSRLASLTSSSARSAAFIIVTHHKDEASSVEWLSKAGITFSNLDADGKYALLIRLLMLGRWETALEYASNLSEDDYLQTPALYHVAAMANLVQVIPGDFKSFVLHEVPFEAHTFPLASNVESVQFRTQARNLFRKCSGAARELECEKAANIADDYALWLELRDQESWSFGHERLLVSMRNPAHSLRRLHLALQFGLKLDINAVEQEIERQTALSGGSNRDIAFARFSLAFTQKNPKDIANYIDRHRNELQIHLGNRLVDFVEIEMLAQAGFPQRAQGCLNLVIGELSGAEKKHLCRIIAESTGVDPIETRIAQFESSGLLNDLINLVNLLEKQNDWPHLCHFGRLLFNKTLALPDAERLAQALNQTHQYDELAELLRKFPEFLGQSDNLQMFWSWVLYRDGSLAESFVALKKLKAKRDDCNDRLLTVNLAIASGAWETLLPYIEEEWLKKDERAADELMHTAHLAQFVGSPRTKELVSAAVAKDAHNARVLMAAYLLATKAGWEDNDLVAEWFQQAVEHSGEKGPLQKMSLKELGDRKPEWDRRENEIWQQLSAGNIPIFAAANALNKSIIDMLLVPALANRIESDTRRRARIPAYSGGRQPLQYKDYKTIVIDPSALLTLGFLGILDTSCEVFEQIFIAHSTLGWLFQEKQRVSFHQPSRIKEASKIRGLLANQALNSFNCSVKIDSDLATEVGEELAAMIAETQAVSDSSNRQRLVIRTSPVHRIGSLMEEEVDLTAYYSNLCSCMAIVNKLKQKGQLTTTEERRARSYFNLHDKAWLHQSEISDGAILYLDYLSVTHLQHAGLLEKMRPAGLNAYISAEKIKDINALLSYEELTSKVETVIENIRKFLAAGIQTGKIKLGKAKHIDEAKSDILAFHPTLEIFGLANEADAIIVDDRFLNQHSQIENADVLTTLDLFDVLKTKGYITSDKKFDYRTELRRAGYLFVPITNEELQHHFSSAEVNDGRLIETAELRAIRENILQVRMSSFLQLPKEGFWLESLIRIFLHSLPAQWQAENDESTMLARSEWLIQIFDIRRWAHFLNIGNDPYLLKNAYCTQIMSLLLALLDNPSKVQARYWKWIEEHILKKIQEEEPELYSAIINQVKEFISSIVDPAASKEFE